MKKAIGPYLFAVILWLLTYHGLCKRLTVDQMEARDAWVLEARERTHLDLPYEAEIIYKQEHPEEEK